MCECDVICEYDVLCVTMMLWLPSRARPGGHSSLLLNAAENSSRRLCVRGSTSSTRSAGVIGDK